MQRSAASIAKQKETRDHNIRQRMIDTAKAAKHPNLPVAMRDPFAFDWENLPIGEAQQLYAKFKEQFEKAGRILNARAMAAGRAEFYECFMAGKPHCCAKGTKHRMPARGTDYENGYKNPKTGLVTPVLICSENCWIRFQSMLIDQRRERNLIPRGT